MRKGSQTVEKGIEFLSNPGAKEAEECHTSRRAVRATCVSTDFARNDEGAHTTFGRVIVKGHAEAMQEGWLRRLIML